MRIFHCSDLHGSPSKFASLIKISAGYDLVAVSGDLLDLNPYRMVPGQIEAVSAWISELKTPTVICSGNHDNFDDDDSRLAGAAWLRKLKRRHLWVDGDIFEFGGIVIRSIGWGSPLPEAKDSDVWVLHCPPDMCATSIARGGTGWGDFEAGELCRNHLGPRALLGGHVHDRIDWKAKIGRTWSFNAATSDKSGVLSGIVLNLNRNTATFHPSFPLSGSHTDIISLS